jgi:hypothetical protein
MGRVKTQTKQIQQRRKFSKGERTMTNIKRTALVVLSVISLMAGVLGIGHVQFFTSNIMLELLEIVLGVGGLFIAVR